MCWIKLFAHIVFSRKKEHAEQKNDAAIWQVEKLNRPDNFQNKLKRINTSVPATSKTIAKKLTNFTLSIPTQGVLSKSGNIFDQKLHQNVTFSHRCGRQVMRNGDSQF